MEELFVNLDIAKQLKKIQFDKPCMRYLFLAVPDENTIITEPLSLAKNWNEDGLCVSIPMRQQVLDWLYEKYNVWIDPYINVHPDTKEIIFSYRIYTIIEGKRYSKLMVDGFNSTPNGLADQAIKQVLKRIEEKSPTEYIKDIIWPIQL
jgi:hypothetical protein